MAANGGIIGPVNPISAGKNIITSTTCTGSNTFTTQPGTQLVRALVIGGGGGGGMNSGGGGGGGGFRDICGISVYGNADYTLTIGAGGNANYPTSTSGSDSVAGFPSNPITSAGGGRGSGSDACTVEAGGSGGGGGGHPAATKLEVQEILLQQLLLKVNLEEQQIRDLMVALVVVELHVKELHRPQRQLEVE